MEATAPLYKKSGYGAINMKNQIILEFHSKKVTHYIITTLFFLLLWAKVLWAGDEAVQLVVPYCT